MTDVTDLAGRSEGARRLATLREFIATEAGSAIVLLAATLIALVWANSPWRDAYHALWATPVSVEVGPFALSDDLGHWVNDGLMTLFFLLVGLEIRRELDMGELRDRRRVAAPVVAAVGGMALPAGLFLLLNPGGEESRGWAMGMATDTAFALGVLALAGRRSTIRLRVFLLTLVIVDDVVAITLIAIFYSENVMPVPLLAGAALLVVMYLLRRAGVERGSVYVAVGFAIWLAAYLAGIHPTVAGVAMGLITSAYPPTRSALDMASGWVRSFRERPSPQLAAAAARRIVAALSPNERLQHALHPWSSYVVVPLFALANAGIDLSSDLLGRALVSSVTIGIIVALVVGKPLGVLVGAWVATRPRLGGLALTVSWPALIAASFVTGIGFTVSLLIAELSYQGELLDQAKLGILTASAIAGTLGFVAFRVLELLPADLLRRTERLAPPPPAEFVPPVDADEDHIRGSIDAPLTLLEYGDYECPYCRQAEPAVLDLLERWDGRLRHVWRHLPLTDVHPNAALAAEAAEAAHAQGRFWEMHDLLLTRDQPPDARALVAYARELGLDIDRFREDLLTGRHAGRVARDVEGADIANVYATPTFFINERRFDGPFDRASFERALALALVASEDESTAAAASPGTA